MAVIGTSNVSVQNIGNVLNEAGGSVNINQPLTFFTSDAKINKWAKYKPVPLKANFAQDFDSSAPDYDADWWRGDVGNCALKVSYAIGYGKDVLFSSFDYANQFSYILPSGTSSNPFRIGDFVGYDTKAVVPYGINKPSSGEEYYVTSLYRNNVVTNNVLLEDIAFSYSGDTYRLNGMYFGFACKNNSTGEIKWLTYSFTIGAQAGKYEMLEILLSEGSYTSVWFLSTVSKAIGDDDKYAFFVPLESGSFNITIPVYTTVSGLLTNETLPGVYNTLEYAIYIGNNSSSTITLTNCKFYYKYADNSVSESLETGEREVDLGTIEVPVGGYTHEGSVINILNDLTTRGAKVHFVCSQSKYNASNDVPIPK